MLARMAALLLAISGFAAFPARAQNIPGCGPAKVKFDVLLDKATTTLPAPDSGKATLLFLEDTGDNKHWEGAPTLQIGIDGAWAGATRGDSYFSVSLDPGEHHLCSYWQSRLAKLGDPRYVEVLHLTAEPGKTYFFRTQIPAGVAAFLRFEPLDSDEAALLMETFLRAAPHVKK